MNLRDLRNLESKEKRKINRASAMRKFGAAMGVVAATGIAARTFIAPKSGKKTHKDLFECYAHYRNHQGIRL